MENYRWIGIINEKETMIIEKTPKTEENKGEEEEQKKFGKK